MVKGDIGVFLTPTQQFKMDILTLLNKIETLDMDGDKKGYINGVKHLYWKMVKYTPRSIRKYLKELLEDLLKNKKKIDGYSLTSEQKEKKKLNLDYECYNIICESITKIISFSPIVEEEVTGVLETGSDVENINKLHELIKTVTKEELLLMDTGEVDEGMSEKV